MFNFPDTLIKFFVNTIKLRKKPQSWCDACILDKKGSKQVFFFFKFCHMVFILRSNETAQTQTCEGLIARFALIFKSESSPSEKNVSLKSL